MADSKGTLPGEGIVPAANRGRTPAKTDGTTTKKYTVIGPRPVQGVTTGNDVTLTLTKAQEDHLVSVGHIRISTR